MTPPRITYKFKQMNDIKKASVYSTRIDLYRNIYSTKRTGTVTLASLIDKISTSTITLPKKDRKLWGFGSNSAKSKNSKDIQSYTGLMFVDYDEVTDYDRLKDIVSSGRSTVACWKSPSGNLHAIVRIPQCTSSSEYKRRFNAYRSGALKKVSEICVIDRTASSAVHLTFQNSDNAIYVNYQAEPYEGIEAPIRPVTSKVNYKAGDTELLQQIGTYIGSRFRWIKDQGHPQVLEIGRLLGGMIASGQITYDYAVDLVNSKIGNSHYLLSEDSTDSVEKYTEDCINSIEFGQEVPFIFKKKEW